MRYEGKLYRPPSEAHSLILQATIGCSWNHCTYCDMYRDKEFRVRPLEESLEDLDRATETVGPIVEKLFVADGDALILPLDHWLAILEKAKECLKTAITYNRNDLSYIMLGISYPRPLSYSIVLVFFNSKDLSFVQVKST